MWNNQGGGGNQSYGGDQGGGYLNSPGFGSPGMSQEKKKVQRAQNIMPCTVSHVLSATQQDDKFVIDSIELNQVTLVGLVRSVKEQATRLDYEIDDMTGPPLAVHQFVDNDENNPDEERTIPQRENTYVRIMGNVRTFGGKRCMVAFKMIPVTDMNELTCHLLEILQSRIALNKIQDPASTDVNTTGTYNAPTTAYAGATGDMAGLNPIQQQVSMVIKSCVDEEGVSIQHIGEKLRGIPQAAIREAVEFLSSEGHIYSTIDDDHFKSTDAM